MRLVTFTEQAGAGQVGLVHGNWIVDLKAAFESLLIEEERLPVPRTRDAAREAIPRSMLDLIRRGDDGLV